MYWKIVLFSWYIFLKTIGVFGNAPKMLWTDCPDDDACDKCLDVAFQSGNDIACLNEKFPETECILEGNFMNGGSRVFVSSEQCINIGYMDRNILVKFIYSEKATKFCEIFTLLLTGAI